MEQWPMTFACNGRQYRSDDLKAYRTGDGHIPLIYMTVDDARVFFVTMCHWQGIGVCEADPTEITSLSSRFGIEDLKRALAREPAGCL
jgi:type VI protein secretion system component Hcp